MNDITYFKRLIYDSEYHEYYVVIISLDSEKASTIEKLSSTILIMNKKRYLSVGFKHISHYMVIKE